MTPDLAKTQTAAAALRENVMIRQPYRIALATLGVFIALA
ncbi:MAG: DUF2964 family protein, partial [Burkholderia sp.]|nr:DUF2964 family protein [Burkholderia sp.]